MSNITPEIIEKIAFSEDKNLKIEQRDCILIQTLLLELYYYSKKQNKFLDVNTSIESIGNTVNFFLQNLIERNVDIWDATFILEKDIKENEKYFEKHNLLYEDLGGRKRSKEVQEKLYNNTLFKIGNFILQQG